jgi:hypothetical protein
MCLLAERAGKLKGPSIFLGLSIALTHSCTHSCARTHTHTHTHTHTQDYASQHTLELLALPLDASHAPKRSRGLRCVRERAINECLCV